jgi:hypothetical protein
MSQYSRWPLNNIDPKLYLNRGVRSIFFALKPDCSTSFPIGQLTYILEREKAKTLIKIEFDEDRITAALKNSKNINERVRNFLIILKFLYLRTRNGKKRGGKNGSTKVKISFFLFFYFLKFIAISK